MRPRGVPYVRATRRLTAKYNVQASEGPAEELEDREFGERSVKVPTLQCGDAGAHQPDEDDDDGNGRRGAFGDELPYDDHPQDEGEHRGEYGNENTQKGARRLLIDVDEFAREVAGFPETSQKPGDLPCQKDDEPTAEARSQFRMLQRRRKSLGPFDENPGRDGDDNGDQSQNKEGLEVQGIRKKGEQVLHDGLRVRDASKKGRNFTASGKFQGFFFERSCFRGGVFDPAGAVTGFGVFF